MFRILTPIILIVVSILVGFLYIKPLYLDSMSSLEHKRDVDDSLQKNKEIQKIAKRLSADISSITQSDFDKLKVILPNSVDEIRLLNDFNTIALRHGITLNNLRVGEKTNSNISAKKDKPIVNVLSVDFSATSFSYNTFKLFLEDIERSMKLMDINSISFSVIDADATNPSGSYSYGVSFNTYWIE